MEMLTIHPRLIPVAATFEVNICNQDMFQDIDAKVKVKLALNIDDITLAVSQQISDHRRANKPGTAGYNYCSWFAHLVILKYGDSQSPDWTLA